jgi:putative SOS response-associated peptidase YedK
MCGRYGYSQDGKATAEQLHAELRSASAEPSYNVAPTQHAPVVVHEGGARYLDMYRWGLIPFWAKDPSIGNRMINARCETAPEKPAFREAFKRRRCLVPVSGFYEWQKTPYGKVPHWIHPADGELLTFAGLWEEWRPKDAEPVHSYTILTTAANPFMQQLHDRMPVILSPEEREVWLDSTASAYALKALLRPGPADLLQAHPVTTRVNTPANNDPRLIERALQPEAGSYERNPK